MDVLLLYRSLIVYDDVRLGLGTVCTWFVEAIVLGKLAVSIFSPEGGDSMDLQSIGFYQQIHMAPKPKRTSS
jgi:hypothetical protein